MDSSSYNRQLRRLSGKMAHDTLPQMPEKLKRLEQQKTAIASSNAERFSFFRKMKKLYGDSLPEGDQISILANQMHQEFTRGIEFYHFFDAVLPLLRVIQDVSAAITKGRESEMTRQTTELLLEAVVLRVALSLFKHYSSTEEKILTSVQKDFGDQYEAIRLMKECFVQCQDVQRFAHLLGERVTALLPDFNENEREMKNLNDELFQEMKRLQRYTVKSVEYDDMMMPYPKSVWVIANPKELPVAEEHDSEARKLSRRMRNGGFAVFQLLSRVTNDVEEYHTLQDLCKGSRVAVLVDQSNPSHIGLMLDSMSFHLDCQDGELYVRLYPLRIPLRAFFQRANAVGAYEYLRCSFISAVFDNIAPRKIYEQTPSLQALHEKLLTMASTSSSERFKTFRDFIAPRTLLIRSTSDEQIVHDIAEESAEYEEIKIQRQFLGRVGHPMRVRAGYRPHPDARNWAKEDGFHRELEENETWCRPVDSPVPVVHRQKGKKN